MYHHQKIYNEYDLVRVHIGQVDHAQKLDHHWIYRILVNSDLIKINSNVKFKIASIRLSNFIQKIEASVYVQFFVF
jgi:desulfoferrodoxin (superoxide reductase-like protein)